MGTEGQFIVGRLPGTIVADSGCGSEERYAFLERKRIRAFVKDSMFRREGEKPCARQVYLEENMPRDAERDRSPCPAGRHLSFRHIQHSVTGTGCAPRPPFGLRHPKG